ncbi:hypothetical protein GRJ2_003201600 [Grus japonensis]|uniref:Uncharacterized protein n=1 Tax=Grus japonensis TaxID=30415 RepID=A0ABC9YDI2_GRUJA
MAPIAASRQQFGKRVPAPAPLPRGWGLLPSPGEVHAGSFC